MAVVCPQCAKPMPVLKTPCPACRADLDLLVEYVSNLDEGLRQAEMLTRAGELDLAVWAYLSVLETDPDNATARRQVGKVATAVRVFDRLAPGRVPERWEDLVRGNAPAPAGRTPRWLTPALVLVLVLLAFGLGYCWGSLSGGPA